MADRKVMTLAEELREVARGSDPFMNGLLARAAAALQAKDEALTKLLAACNLAECPSGGPTAAMAAAEDAGRAALLAGSDGAL